MYAGTGLGLGIVKRLVAMLGGTISLESRAGKGTSIYFTIKMKSAGSEIEACNQPLYVRSEAGRSLTVLLAEDDQINRLIGGSLLDNMGHKVVFAENGREVMQILAIRQDIDCILMDIQMPEMDGVETSRAIRRSQPGLSSTSIPIIALTAHALSGDRERFMAAGMDEYLTKPYKADELRSVLDRVRTLAGHR
jgi:CheY-like chemotaxis protein